MRKAIWLTAILAALAMPQLAAAQQASQSEQTSQSQDKQTTQSTAKTATPQPQSLAEAARKARAAEKKAPKAPTVFTNDNIPTASTGVSVVGQAPAATSKSSANSETQANGGNEETAWRQKFSDARHKIDQDKADLAVMQRELGELNLQYYPDPTEAMKQSVSRSDIDKKQKAIDDKQKQLAADEQALSNLEDELHKAGGDAAWARE